MSLDRSPAVSQRASDIQQAHAASESAAMLARRRADAADQMRRDKIKEERERKRRQTEHNAQNQPSADEPETGGSFLDVVV